MWRKNAGIFSRIFRNTGCIGGNCDIPVGDIISFGFAFLCSHPTVVFGGEERVRASFKSWSRLSQNDVSVSWTELESREIVGLGLAMDFWKLRSHNLHFFLFPRRRSKSTMVPQMEASLSFNSRIPGIYGYRSFNGTFPPVLSQCAYFWCFISELPDVADPQKLLRHKRPMVVGWGEAARIKDRSYAAKIAGCHWELCWGPASFAVRRFTVGMSLSCCFLLVSIGKYCQSTLLHPW